ncbi:MAG: T9SS type A sorting domain-containing protein [Bacteroidales bacterium]|nr:T9SS type A sorting domain-containing protein [Bacteroidales bacterium]
MKKSLMVLTFALCATFVFAQTATPRMKEYKAPAKAAQVQDYSGSIFTKDATPLLSVDFHADNYGYTTGIVSTGSEQHAENYDYATWHRWADASEATLNTAASTYSALVQNYFGGSDRYLTNMQNYLDTANSSTENGWMMMSPYDQRTPFSGNFNAFIRFDNIDASEAAVVDVEFFQYYRKYYDNCYLDYSTNGTTWVEMEINVTGVDINVNGTLWGVKLYTLPIAAAGNDNLSIRLRYKSLDANLSAYGYFWIVDDFNVIAGPADRLNKYAQEYVEGNYGMIPQGMTINPAWYTQVKNSGSNVQNNVEAKIFHLNAAQDEATLIVSYDNGSIAPSTYKEVIADRAGWLLPDSLDYRGWYGYIDHTAHGTGMALPTATAGDNYMFAQLSNDALTINYDTMYYQVTTANSNNEYTWAHDNGVLTYSPFNYWMFGYVLSGGNWYVTEDPEEVHYYQAGYMVTTRYTTDEVVPADWVIHGVELVASPVDGYHSTGSKISAILYRDEYDGGSVGFRGVNTGANVKEISAADVNDSNVIGRNSAGYLLNGNYNTIYIPFPEQPALTSNTSFRVGYAIEEDGYFAVANEAFGNYRVASPTRPDTYDTIIYFKNNEATAKYAHYFPLNQYQNYINDPSYGGDGYSSTFTFDFVDYNPMIRLIVGPAREIVRKSVSIECENAEFGEASYGGVVVCDSTITPAAGSSVTIVGECFAGCTADVYIDGQLVQPYDEDTEEGDTRVIKTTDPDANADLFYVTLPEIDADHAIKFVYREKTSIDPVAASARLTLNPNPATSQVNVNIQGVTGMVNCSLIDMSGRVVYSQNMNAESAQVISLNNLAKGAYFVRITNDKFSKIEKLIVR